MQSKRFIVVMLAFPIGLFTLFVVYPYFWAVGIGFTQWRGLSVPPAWVGLDNFGEVLVSSGFWGALRNNLEYAFLLPLLTVSIALFLATQLAQRTTSLGEFYRVVYLFPQVMSVVMVAMVWSFIYHPRIGLLNSALDTVGLDGRSWLGDRATAQMALIAVIVWNSVGFHTILFIAAIRSIPGEMYEAATLDGANRWQQVRYVTLPLLRDPIRVSAFYMALEAFDLFAITRIMTNGGPNGSTSVLGTYMYTEAFSYGRFGYASAVAVVMFLIMIVVSSVALFAERRTRIEF